MKKIMMLICILLSMTGCSAGHTAPSGGGAAAGVIGEDMPIKRSQVAKMLALSVYDINTVENMQRSIVFVDTDKDMPYDKYINAAFAAGLISGADETHFEPMAYLSLEQAQFLLNKLDKSGTLKLQYNNEDRKKPISAAMWTEVYERAMQLNQNNAVVSCNIVPYATGKNCAALGERFIMTDRGLLSGECCDFSDYNDSTVSVLLRDKEIIAFKAVINNEPSVIGAVVLNTDDDGVTLDMGGIERYFYADDISGIKNGESVSFKYSGSHITALESGQPAVENVSVIQ